MEKSSKQKAIQSGMSKKKSAETLTRREDGFGKWLRAGPASALLPIAELVTQRRLELSVEAVTSLPAYSILVERKSNLQRPNQETTNSIAEALEIIHLSSCILSYGFVSRSVSKMLFLAAKPICDHDLPSLCSLSGLCSNLLRHISRTYRSVATLRSNRNSCSIAIELHVVL